MLVPISSQFDPKQKCFRVTQRSSDSPYREISRDGRLEIPACALFDVSVGKQIINGRRVMMLKLGRIAVVSMAALTFAAVTIPTKAEAADLFIPRGHGPVAYGDAGCGCQVWVPPPPPPCCAPPPCCVYGGGYSGGYGGGGYGGGGYGGGYGVGYDGGGYGGGY